MPPVCSQRTPCSVKEFLPIDVARLHAGRCRVAAIIQRDRAPLRVSHFGEVQTDAIDFADAIVLASDGMGDIHADRTSVVRLRSGPSAKC